MGLKIINIEHTDEMEDILSALDTAEASEFFLVVPRTHRVFSDAVFVRHIGSHAAQKDKNITIISEDPKINAIVLDAGLTVLQEHKPAHKTKNTRSIPVIKLQEVIPTIPGQSIPLEQNADDAQTHAITPLNIEDIDQPTEQIKPPLLPDVQLASSPDLSEIEKLYRNKEEFAQPILNEVHEFHPELSRKVEVFPDRDITQRITKKFSKKLTYAIAAAFIAVVIFGIMNASQSGKVIITPQKEEITFGLQLQAVAQPTHDNQVAGTPLTVEKTISKTFSSSGEKFLEQKARGKITVYNEFSSDPQILVATTRFQTEDGLIFRTPQTVTVPGAVIQNGVLTPGTIELEIVADRAGDKYNVPAGRFSIPGFKGTEKYSKFYAQSNTPMKNGFRGNTKYATEENIKKATEEVNQLVAEALKQEIQNRVGEDNLIFEQAFSQSIIPTSGNAQEGEIGQQFRIELTGKLSTMAISKDGLTSAIEKQLNQQNTSSYRNILVDTLSYQIESPRLESDPDRLYFTLRGKVKAVAVVDQQKLLAAIAGLNAVQIREYFSQQKNIQKAQILISPFWKKSLPKNSSRIKIDIMQK